MLLTIVGISLIGIVINSILKNVKPELAILSTLATCLIIVICVIELVGDVVSKVMAFVSELGISHNIFTALFKVLGISYIIEFMVDFAEESGAVSIANKIAFAGKVLVASLSLPVLFDLIKLLMDMV